MYFVYILKSKSYSKTYTGITNDLVRRLREHKNGYHLYTKLYRPWVIKYHERLKSRKEARLREKYFKSSSGRKWLRENVFSN